MHLGMATFLILEALLLALGLSFCVSTMSFIHEEMQSLLDNETYSEDVLKDKIKNAQLRTHFIMLGMVELVIIYGIFVFAYFKEVYGSLGIF